jgi:hypothetical protein
MSYISPLTHQEQHTHTHMHAYIHKHTCILKITKYCNSHRRQYVGIHIYDMLETHVEHNNAYDSPLSHQEQHIRAQICIPKLTKHCISHRRHMKKNLYKIWVRYRNEIWVHESQWNIRYVKKNMHKIWVRYRNEIWVHESQWNIR